MTFTSENYRNKIITKFNNFCFRRVFKISFAPQLPTSWTKLYLTSYGLIHRTTKEKPNHDDQLLAEFPRCVRFYGFTSNNILQEESDPFENGNLYFSSQTECDLNENGDLVQIPNFKKGFPPKKDQLICGIVSPMMYDKCRPYIKWFKCSEQFYTTLTMIRQQKIINTLIELETHFQSVETNRLRRLAEELSQHYKAQISSLLLQNTLDNEFTESFSHITHFYQFLLRDCLYPDLDISWDNISTSSYYKLHSELYLLFRQKILYSSSSSESSSSSSESLFCNSSSENVSSVTSKSKSSFSESEFSSNSENSESDGSTIRSGCDNISITFPSSIEISTRLECNI